MACRLALHEEFTLMSAVLALKSLQKFMMFSPACPRAGPTGGAGFAWPAFITSLIVAVTALAFFDMLHDERVYPGHSVPQVTAEHHVCLT